MPMLGLAVGAGLTILALQQTQQQCMERKVVEMVQPQLQGKGNEVRTLSPTYGEALPKDKEYISVKADYKVSLVKISDIVYLESEGEYVRMHLADGTTITTLFRLKNMEAALPSDMFMRVHRSYIVNLRCIKGYVRGRVFLSDTEYVPIGENYKESFQHYIESNFKNL